MMGKTGQTQQPDLPVRPVEQYARAAGQSAYEWQQENTSAQRHAPLRVLLDLTPEQDQAGEPATEPAAGPVGDPAAEQAAPAEDDLLIIPPRPADRRAEDFLPGWVRRFSRAGIF